MRELVEGLLGCVCLGRGTVLVEEQLTEGLVENGTVPLDLILGHQRVVLAGLAITTLVILIRCKLQEVPVGSDEELFGLLQSVRLAQLVSHVDVGISKHEVGWKELDGVLTEDLVADHVSHLIVHEAVGLLVTCLNNQTLSCLNCLIYLGFLYNQISFFSIGSNAWHIRCEATSVLSI